MKMCWRIIIQVQGLTEVTFVDISLGDSALINGQMENLLQKLKLILIQHQSSSVFMRATKFLMNSDKHNLELGVQPDILQQLLNIRRDGSLPKHAACKTTSCYERFVEAKETLCPLLTPAGKRTESLEHLCLGPKGKPLHWNHDKNLNRKQMEFHIREAAEATDVYLSRRCLLWTGQYTHKLRGKGQGFKKYIPLYLRHVIYESDKKRRLNSGAALPQTNRKNVTNLIVAQRLCTWCFVFIVCFQCL